MPPLRLISIRRDISTCSVCSLAAYHQQKHKIECLTVAIERGAERCSHGDKPHTLVQARTLPDTKVIDLGPHQGGAALGGVHLRFGGCGSLDHVGVALALVLRHRGGR